MENLQRLAYLKKINLGREYQLNFGKQIRNMAILGYTSTQILDKLEVNYSEKGLRYHQGAIGFAIRGNQGEESEYSYSSLLTIKEQDKRLKVIKSNHRYIQSHPNFIQNQIKNGKKSPLIKDKVLWSKPEQRYLINIANKAPFNISRASNSLYDNKLLTLALNSMFHNNQQVRTEKAINVRLNKLRKKGKLEEKINWKEIYE